MAIFLQTGSPGAGKTLSIVRRIIEEIVPTGRAVYVDINGFDHGRAGTIPFDSPDEKPAGHHWESVPDGSVVVLDECQRAFPPRNPASAVPGWIRAMETHRHRGIDIYLITQSPKLIDRHIWPLIERHFHVHRAFGMKRSAAYQWEGICESPEPEQSFSTAAKSQFIFPSQYFGYYQSATSHSIKIRLPVKQIAWLCVFILIVIGGITYVSTDLFAKAKPKHSGETAPEVSTEKTAAGKKSTAAECLSVVGMISDRLIYSTSSGDLFVWKWAAPGAPVVGERLRCAP